VTSTGTYAYADRDFDDEPPERPAGGRRWPGTVLALLLVLCGAGGAVWFGQDDRALVEVVVLARQLPRGHVLAADDLAVVRLAADGGTVRVTSPAAGGRLVGGALLVDLPAGTVLAPEMVGSAAPPAGFVTVGARLPAEGLPGPSVRAGQRVDVLAVDPATGRAELLARDAEVGAVAPPEAGGSGGTVVYLVVPASDAGPVAAAAAGDGGVRLLGTGRRP
jgi:hypothetical protein